MALKRSSTAVWNGSGAKGNGKLTTLSGAFKDQPYSANAFQLSNAGFEAPALRTEAVVSMEKQEPGWTITNIHLDVAGKVPNVSAEQFQTLAENAKKGCPISRALAGNNITMTAKLLS
jgi:osmotically inducible protein OsmC